MLKRALSINPAVADLSLTRATVAMCGRVLRLLPRMGPCAPAASLASLALLCAQPAAVEDLVRATFRLPQPEPDDPSLVRDASWRLSYVDGC